VRNKARNTAHATLSLYMHHQAATHQTTGNFYVATGEPLVKTYLQRRNVNNNQLLTLPSYQARTINPMLPSLMSPLQRIMPNYFHITSYAHNIHDVFTS